MLPLKIIFVLLMIIYTIRSRGVFILLKPLRLSLTLNVLVNDENHLRGQSQSLINLRGQFDKCLASPPERATIAREIYYRVVHSRRRLLSKFQSNRTRSFV